MLSGSEGRRNCITTDRSELVIFPHRLQKKLDLPSLEDVCHPRYFI